MSVVTVEQSLMVAAQYAILPQDVLGGQITFFGHSLISTASLEWGLFDFFGVLLTQILSIAACCWGRQKSTNKKLDPHV